ncbi:MAG: 6-phosphofructokinase [Armatimonadetes bacterium]|jgi:6-phosphofructokinase 1|nr:6-phosphofructokinase [Armatimonadota bacterium]MDI9601976.1 6-phosphofructokinase [Acidobacteriota bacterium]NLN89039.1 6-phosphofructokinase [candidate division WS1 bacterium]
MADKLRGNLVVAQSGGPTAVINNSVVGVVDEAFRHACIEEVYGSFRGIGGILEENLMDLRQEDPRTIRGLRSTPGAALGSIRLKVKDHHLPRMVEVFKAHNVRYFFYIGGNDSQITSDDVKNLAAQEGWEMRVIGIPKTIDNDLPETDHCPGFGSAARYTATTIRELDRDNHSLPYVYVVEVMGRDAGWMTASAQLAKVDERTGPHIILLPESVFDAQRFLDAVQNDVDRYGRCVIAVSEGIKDAEGNPVAAAEKVDAFGNRQLGGVSQTLAENIEERLGVSARWTKAAAIQRCATHIASPTDVEEAYMVGLAAVRAAVDGETGKMVTLVRESDTPYRCTTGLVDLAKVRGRTRDVPIEWYNAQEMEMTEEFIKYVAPLAGPIPEVAILEGHFAAKLCAPWQDPSKKK